MHGLLQGLQNISLNMEHQVGNHDRVGRRQWDSEQSSQL